MKKPSLDDIVPLFRAKKILLEVTERVKRDFFLADESLRLDVGGVSNFRNNVVYAKVKDGSAKVKLHEIAGKGSTIT